MTEKLIKNCRNTLPGLLISLLFIIQILPACMAAKEMKADYSGWLLTDAFADLAMKARINIVCAFPDQKNGYFKLNETVYFEEAMSLLAKINRMYPRFNTRKWSPVYNHKQP